MLCTQCGHFPRLHWDIGSKADDEGVSELRPGCLLCDCTGYTLRKSDVAVAQ